MAYNYTVDERSNGGYYDAPQNLNNDFVVAENSIAYGTNVDRFTTSRHDVDTYSLGMLDEGEYRVILSNDKWQFNSINNDGNSTASVQNSNGVTVTNGILFTVNEPDTFYVSIKGGNSSSILDIGGKGIRPYLVLMSTSVFGKDPKLSLNAALSVECVHNFTLMHDDIMDSASLRRGNETVHLKWNTNQSILSGDALLIYSYKLLEDYNPVIFKKLNNVLNTTALQVCEGQQFDIDFEKNREE